MAAGDLLTIRPIVNERIRLLDVEGAEFETLIATSSLTTEQSRRLRTMLREFRMFHQILMMATTHYPDMCRIKQKLQRIKQMIKMFPEQILFENEEER